MKSFLAVVTLTTGMALFSQAVSASSLLEDAGMAPVSPAIFDSSSKSLLEDARSGSSPAATNANGDPLPDCATFSEDGKRLILNSEAGITSHVIGVMLEDGRAPGLSPSLLTLVKEDRVDTITINGMLRYVGSSLVDLAAVLPQLKKLKVLDLDLFFGDEDFETIDTQCKDWFQQSHGLQIKLRCCSEVLKVIDIQ